MTQGWATLMIGHEGVAVRVLEALGYDVYAPRYRAILRGARLLPNGRRVRSRTDTVMLRPLFPGYLFCRYDVAAWQRGELDWWTVRSALQVRGIIMGDDQEPTLLRPEVITELQEGEASGVWDEVADETMLRRQLDAGERPAVAVPGLDVVGQLVGLDDNGRAQVLLGMLGSIRLTVDGRVLRLVAPQVGPETAGQPQNRR